MWGSLWVIVAAHTSLWMRAAPLVGSAEQKERYLVPMARGEVIGVYGGTEARRRQRFGWHPDDGRFEDEAEGARG